MDIVNRIEHLPSGYLRFLGHFLTYLYTYQIPVQSVNLPGTMGPST